MGRDIDTRPESFENDPVRGSRGNEAVPSSAVMAKIATDFRRALDEARASRPNSFMTADDVEAFQNAPVIPTAKFADPDAGFEDDLDGELAA